MKITDAIKKVERQQMNAQEIAEKYLKKGNEMAYFAVECEADQKSKREMLRAEAKRDCYFQKYAVAIDYAEELEEVIEVLKNKDDDEKILFVNEERFENEYSLYGDSEEEWGNTIASMVKCDLGNGTSVIAICLKKLFS